VYDVTLRCVCVTIIAVGKQYYILCVSVDLVIQLAKCMCHIISIISMASLAVPYFSALYHKRHDFRKEVFEREMYVLIFSTTFA
jgi:hypothetical protein